MCRRSAGASPQAPPALRGSAAHGGNSGQLMMPMPANETPPHYGGVSASGIAPALRLSAN